ncbi:hypothetical protein BH10PSE19_BH10PSE19_21570 [soil metagenome]
MIIVNTHEAKTRLSQLLVAIEEQHEKVRICRHGKPIADIVPISQEIIDPLQQYATLTQGAKILGDLTAPLSDDAWPEEWR